MFTMQYGSVQVQLGIASNRLAPCSLQPATARRVACGWPRRGRSATVAAARCGLRSGFGTRSATGVRRAYWRRCAPPACRISMRCTSVTCIWLPGCRGCGPATWSSWSAIPSHSRRRCGLRLPAPRRPGICCWRSRPSRGSPIRWPPACAARCAPSSGCRCRPRPWCRPRASTCCKAGRCKAVRCTAAGCTPCPRRRSGACSTR